MKHQASYDALRALDALQARNGFGVPVLSKHGETLRAARMASDMVEAGVAVEAEGCLQVTPAGRRVLRELYGRCQLDEPWALTPRRPPAPDGPERPEVFRSR